MIIKIIAAVIIAVIFVISAYVFATCKRNSVGIISSALAVLMFFGFILVPWSFNTVNSGSVAVVKHLGKFTDVRMPGTYFDFWITNRYAKYDTKVRTITLETAAYSADAQPMDISMTIQYQIMTDKVVDIATQYGSISTLEDRISSIAIEKAKSTLSKSKAMNIIANRATISPEVESVIKNAVDEEYFVDIVTVVLTNIDFSDAFELAVEEKMIAEQTKLKADYENQTKVARANTDIEIARAEAEAMKIAAEGEAEANKIVNASLTDLILENKLIDAWDGKLPTVVGEGDYILPSDVIG